MLFCSDLEAVAYIDAKSEIVGKWQSKCFKDRVASKVSQRHESQLAKCTQYEMFLDDEVNSNIKSHIESTVIYASILFIK